MRRTVGRWQIEHEADATSECFTRLAGGAACTCNQCRNFKAASDKAFPAAFVALADALGIDLAQPAELIHYTREPSGLYLTGGWFHLVGAILDGHDATPAEGGSGHLPLAEIPSGFAFGLSSRSELVPKVFAGLPVIQLDFIAHVPWVLPEPPPE